MDDVTRLRLGYEDRNCASSKNVSQDEAAIRGIPRSRFLKLRFSTFGRRPPVTVAWGIVGIAPGRQKNTRFIGQRPCSLDLRYR